MAATMSPHSIIVTLNTVAATTATHAMNMWIAQTMLRAKKLVEGLAARDQTYFSKNEDGVDYA